MPDANTVTVRSVNARPVFCAGHKIATDPITLVATPTTLADLYSKRAALVVEWWPLSYIGPDGGCPGATQAAERAAKQARDTARAALQASLASTVAAARTMAVATLPPATPPSAATAPKEPAAAATEPALQPAMAEPVWTYDPSAPVPEPPWVRRTTSVTPAAEKKREVGTYKNKDAAQVAGSMFGQLAEQLKALGVQPPTTQVAQELGPGLTLERLIDTLAYEGSKFYPSRVQRALVRATDGRSTAGPLAPPTMAANADPAVSAPLSVEEHFYHFGSWSPLGPIAMPPRLVYLRSGIRSGKTKLAAIGVIKSALTCIARRPPTPEEIAAGAEIGADGLVHALQANETLKVFFVTPKVSQSAAAFNYVVGAIMGSPRLAKCVIKRNTEELRLRRPCDGVEISFRCEAASPQGNNLRSGWLAGAIFDEAAFFDQNDDAAVTLQDNVTAALARLLTGAQIWLPSSPWADDGYWHEEHDKHQKRAAKQGADSEALAFHSSSRRLNPALPVGLEETIADPMERAREYDATPVSAMSDLFFPPGVLALAIDNSRTHSAGTVRLPPIAGIHHYAGVDLGFRENSSTLAIARNVMRVVRGADDIPRPVDVATVAYHEELIAPVGKPLVPSDVVGGFGRTCQQYGCASMRGDFHYVDTAIEHLAKLPGNPITYDAWAPTQERTAAMFSRVRELMTEGRISLPNDPRLVSQFKLVLGRKSGGGKFQVVLPRVGRAHCDLVVSAVTALALAAEGASNVLAYESNYDHKVDIGMGRVPVARAQEDGGGDGIGQGWGGFGADRSTTDW